MIRNMILEALMTRYTKIQSTTKNRVRAAQKIVVVFLAVSAVACAHQNEHQKSQIRPSGSGDSLPERTTDTYTQRQRDAMVDKVNMMVHQEALLAAACYRAGRRVSTPEGCEERAQECIAGASEEDIAQLVRAYTNALKETRQRIGEMLLDRCAIPESTALACVSDSTTQLEQSLKDASSCDEPPEVVEPASCEQVAAIRERLRCGAPVQEAAPALAPERRAPVRVTDLSEAEKNAEMVEGVETAPEPSNPESSNPESANHDNASPEME